MKVSIIIPTYDRIESLKKTMQSILAQDYKDIQTIIIVDGNEEMLKQVPTENATVLFNETRMDWIYSMNRGLRETKDTDATMYASDDLEFPPYAVSKAVKEMRARFPDGDGLIALKQSCAGVDSAFGLIGKAFIDHFPDRAVFCSDYIHYVSDVEIGQYAKSIKKFYMCEEVILKHHRPKDKTRELGLEVFGIDRATRAERARKGLLWGRDFERVRK